MTKKSEVKLGFRERLRAESAERGWLFGVVSGWCVVMGLLCVVAGMAAWAKWLWGEGASAEAVVRMLVAGALILATTERMWKLSIWGRNIAIVTVAALCWVLGQAISRRTGVGIEAQAMTVVFVSLSLSCFTSSHVRNLYKRLEEDGEDEGQKQ